MKVPSISTALHGFRDQSKRVLYDFRSSVSLTADIHISPSKKRSPWQALTFFFTLLSESDQIISTRGKKKSAILTHHKLELIQVQIITAVNGTSHGSASLLPLPFPCESFMLGYLALGLCFNAF